MKIIVQNLATEYRDEGEGPVMLLLHGWKDSLYTFDDLMPSLLARWRVVRLDLPGFGESEAPGGAWNLDDYIHFVNEFIQKLNLQVDVLAGHSFGGRIAIKGQAVKLFKANKLVLIAPAGIARKQKLRKSILKVMAKIGGFLADIPPLILWRQEIRKKMYNLIGSDYLNAGPLRGTFLKIIAEDLSVKARDITVPTLIIWGANDTQTPLADGQKLSRLVSGSEFKVINGAGHFVHREKHQEVAKLIEDFYDKKMAVSL